MAHRALRLPVSIYAERVLSMHPPTQRSCAHRREFFTVIAPATPTAFDVRTMDFIGCGKRGSRGRGMRGHVKGTLRIAGLRNAAQEEGGGAAGDRWTLRAIYHRARAHIRHPFVNSSQARCREAGSFRARTEPRSSRGCFDGSPLLLRRDSRARARVAAALRSIGMHGRRRAVCSAIRRMALRDTRALSIPEHCLRRTMQFIVIGHDVTPRRNARR